MKHENSDGKNQVYTDEVHKTKKNKRVKEREDGEGSYFTIERRRFSEAMMWSVEVGIQRRTEGHNDLFDDLVTVVVAAAADELICSAIVANRFDHLRRRILRLMHFLIKI